MKKSECSKLQVQAYTIMETVAHAIKGLTEDKPLVLFDPETVGDDEVYDYPFGYVVGRHGDYFSGNVKSVCGNDVVLYCRGENDEEFEMEVEQLPFSSQIDLLSYIEKTLKD